MNPASIRCDTAARHEAMGMRMMRQGLAPGMENGDHPVSAPRCFGSALMRRIVSAAALSRMS